MTFEIYYNGAWQDISQYISFQGVTNTRNDVDGPNAGRDLTGTMIRDRVGIKQKYPITTKPIDKTTMLSIKAMVQPESFQIRTDYDTATVQTYTVYSNNVQSVYLFCQPHTGVEYYKLSFPLIEM